MSSGWTRRSVCVAPVPFGWKLCFSVSPKMSCLTVNVLGVALVLGVLELELEHPAEPNRPAATTVAPSQVAVRRLKMFIGRFVCDPGDARRSRAKGSGERPMARRGLSSKGLVNAGQRSGLVNLCHERPRPELQRCSLAVLSLFILVGRSGLRSRPGPRRGFPERLRAARARLQRRSQRDRTRYAGRRLAALGSA